MVDKEMFPNWPEVDIGTVLKKYDITPSQRTYGLVYDKKEDTLFLVNQENIFVKYERQPLASGGKDVKIKNLKMSFDAVLVEEGGERRGVGIYSSMIEGGQGDMFFSLGQKFKDPSVKKLEPVDFLLKL